MEFNYIEKNGRSMTWSFTTNKTYDILYYLNLYETGAINNVTYFSSSYDTWDRLPQGSLEVKLYNDHKYHFKSSGGNETVTYMLHVNDNNIDRVFLLEETDFISNNYIPKLFLPDTDMCDALGIKSNFLDIYENDLHSAYSYWSIDEYLLREYERNMRTHYIEFEQIVDDEADYMYFTDDFLKNCAEYDTYYGVDYDKNYTISDP